MIFSSFIFILFISNNLFQSSFGYGSGPPLTQIICETLNPIGHMGRNSKNDSLNFEVTTDRDWFSPGEVVEITLRSTTSSPFKGLLMHVTNETNHISGSILLDREETDYQYYRCDYLIKNLMRNSTVCHRNSRDKFNATFRWKAPSSCKGLKYVIGATILKNLTSYQTGVSKTLECRSNVVEEVSMQQNVCRYMNVTSVPNHRYRTSFEELDLNGWNNSGWDFQKGSTATQETGPSSAIDGNIYMYYETSFSRRLRWKVSLKTDQDLRGCFCVILSQCHNVQNNKNHRFEVVAGEETLYHIDRKRESWKKLALQVDTDKFIKVELIGKRGKNFRGDMAIDDVIIVPGLCPNQAA